MEKVQINDAEMKKLWKHPSIIAIHKTALSNKLKQKRMLPIDEVKSIIFQEETAISMALEDAPLAKIRIKDEYKKRMTEKFEKILRFKNNTPQLFSKSGSILPIENTSALLKDIPQYLIKSILYDNKRFIKHLNDVDKHWIYYALKKWEIVKDLKKKYNIE